MLRSAAKHTAFCFTPSAKQDDLVFTGTLQHLANPLRSFRTCSLIRSLCGWCPTKSYLSWHGGLTPENLKPGSQTRRNMLCWPLGIRSVLHCNDFPSYYACTPASSKARRFQLCWSQLSLNKCALKRLYYVIWCVDTKHFQSCWCLCCVQQEEALLITHKCFYRSRRRFQL